MKKVFIETHGCSSNQADSQIMAGLLQQDGFEITKRYSQSDLIILNTCSVKVPTSNRMRHRIEELMKLNKPLIVAGCMPKIERETIEKINPYASMLGPNSIEKVVDVARATLKGNKVVFLDDLKKPKALLPRIEKNPVISIVEIGSGCLSYCSYCCVKFARGRLSSYPPHLIIERIKQDIFHQFKEIWITSQDNACYGKDIGTCLPELLERICKIDRRFFIRVGMMNPTYLKSFLQELIGCYKNEKIFKFLHLPVQSFSPRILSLMKRGYSPEEAMKIINKFLEEIPKLTFATDVIVGFPTESEKEFEETIEFIEKVKPDIVNISKFGARPRTEASRLKPLQPQAVNKRSKELHEICKAIALEKNQQWIGWEGECLIDEVGTKKNTWIGRNFAYKPIVVCSTKALLGKFVNLRISDAKSNYLIGEVVN